MTGGNLFRRHCSIAMPANSIKSMLFIRLLAGTDRCQHDNRSVSTTHVYEQHRRGGSHASIQMVGPNSSIPPALPALLITWMAGFPNITAHTEQQALSLTASHREYNSRSAKTEEVVVIVMSCLHSQGILGIFLPGHLTACSIPPSLPAVSSYS